MQDEQLAARRADRSADRALCCIGSDRGIENLKLTIRDRDRRTVISFIDREGRAVDQRLSGRDMHGTAELRVLVGEARIANRELAITQNAAAARTRRIVIEGRRDDFSAARRADIDRTAFNVRRIGIEITIGDPQRVIG